jgi:ABC-2 type transport system permease protein
MRRRVRTLVWKEFVELWRSPQLLRLVIVAPILQLTILGYAATTDVRHVPLVVVDGDRSPRSRQLIERFAASPYFDIVKGRAIRRRSKRTWRRAARGSR